MAEDKKGFLLYADLIHTIEKMPSEKAGELFKHILRYVNDLNPISNDLIIDLTFEPIKQQLKRDLVRFEKSKDEKSISGRIGNLKRWHIDLYNQFILKELTIEECEIIANSRKVSQPDKVQSQTVANIAVNDNVSVSVNVNDNVIKKEIKEKKPKTVSGHLQNVSIIYPFDSENFKNKWSIWKEYKHKDHSFKYRSEISEGSALKKLNELSKQNENVAIQIIEQSISNGWAGFFELKNQNNGKSNTTIRTPEQEKADFFAKRYGIDNSGSENTQSEHSEIISIDNVSRKRFGN